MQVLALEDAAKVERHEGHLAIHPGGDQGFHLDAAALGAFDPDIVTVTYADIVGVGRVHLDEHFLLQLRQPRHGAGFFAAPFILDKATRRQNDRVIRAVVTILDGFVHRGQTHDGVKVIPRGVALNQVTTGGVERLTVLRHRIREGPHHGAGFGVTVRCTAVLNSDTLDTA